MPVRRLALRPGPGCFVTSGCAWLRATAGPALGAEYPGAPLDNQCYYYYILFINHWPRNERWMTTYPRIPRSTAGKPSGDSVPSGCAVPQRTPQGQVVAPHVLQCTRQHCSTAALQRTGPASDDFRRQGGCSRSAARVPKARGANTLANARARTHTHTQPRARTRALKHTCPRVRTHRDTRTRARAHTHPR